MSDLISRKQIAEEVKSLRISITGLRAGKGALCLFAAEYIKSVLKLIDEAPSVEAEPKRGRWIVGEQDVAVEYTCSVCGFTYCEADPTIPPEKYCCKCGARNE